MLLDFDSWICKLKFFLELWLTVKAVAVSSESFIASSKQRLKYMIMIMSIQLVFKELRYPTQLLWYWPQVGVYRISGYKYQYLSNEYCDWAAPEEAGTTWP